MTNQFAQDSAALYHLFLVAFNASPGSKYWAQLQALDASGLSGVQVIDAMIKDPNLSKAFPADQSNAAFAQQIGNDLIGELASESAKASAIQLIENALEQTLTRPQVLDALAQYLGALPTKSTQNGFDPSNPYLRVAQSLQKKTVVAQHFTEVMPFQGDDLARLRDSVSRINDQSDVSSIAGIERLIRGFDQSREYDSYQTFVLAFSAAPGNRLLGLIRDEVSNGLSDAEIIDKLLLDPVTSKLYGTNDSSDVFATKLVSQFMRESDPSQLKAGAIDLISQVLQAGWTRGMVIEALAKYLRDIPASPDETGYQANDPLTKIALRLDNKALGAKIYTDFLGADASDITTLRAVLDRIDEQSDLSTPQTIRALMAQSETGRLQDGYIQGATVFADTDNDGVLDPGEQSTVTDAQGNFKLEGAIGNLVAFGGVDIATQLPFSSVYRAPLGSTIINPLTTLVSSLTDTGQTPDAAQALVAKQLGLPASLKLGRYDPLAILADSSSSTGQRSDAADVFKASAMVANAIVQATAAVGSISAADDSDVSKAAAKVLSGFFDGTEKLIDLAQTETLTQLLINTASAVGDPAKLTVVTAEVVQVMQASNREIQKINSNNASAGAIAESIIKAQKVAQGQATNEIEKAVSSGSSTALVANYTGAALVDRIKVTEIGTIGNGLVGTRSNLAPTASNLSSAETYTEDTALNLIDIVVSDTDSANITATLTLSSAAAGSLSVASSGSVTSSFNSATGVWSASGALASVNALLAGLVFTPAANANGNFSMTTSISDGVNSPITGTKLFTGTAVNDAPIVANPITDQSTTTGTPLNFTVPANVFTDVDNSSLTYSAAIEGGTALPSWLNFNTATRTFSGIPTVTSGSPFNIRVTASDGRASVSDFFSLVVVTSGTNAAPLSANGAATTAEDSAVAGNLPAATDANGDVITYARAGAAPNNGTVTVNANGMYTYVPNANFHGSDAFGFSVTDGKGGTNTYTQSITITPANDAPILDPNYTPAPGFSIALNAPAPSGATGVLVSSLLGGVTDPDAGALQGMAIVGTNTAVGGANGTLFYSLNNGSSWTTFGSASSTAGVVSPTAALVLPATARLYFQPASGSTAATLSDLLSFRAWDQTSGAAGTKVNTDINGGTLAFSTATDTVALTLTAVTGTAPVLQTNPLDNVTNLDPTSNIVLNYDIAVTAAPGKYIRIVNDGGSGAVNTTYPTGAGFRGENTINTLSIPVNDTSQVTISGSRVLINPKSDLDLANKYHMEVDAGAFTSAAGLPTVAFDGTTALNFNTITPGRFDLSLAALSKKQNEQGTIVDSFKWLDIEGIGSPSSQSGSLLDLSGDGIAMVFRDYSARPSSAATGYDGIDSGSFNVSATGFGTDDLLYADSQSSESNDLLRTIVINRSTGPSTIQFAPDILTSSLGGFITVALVGSTSVQTFSNINDWQAKLGTSSPPFISG